MANRAMVDFFTNPTYEQVVTRIKSQLEKENASLRAAGRGESEANFNHQTGVCDGIERTLMLLENEHKAALKEDE